jgi:hypothetical protein
MEIPLDAPRVYVPRNVARLVPIAGNARRDFQAAPPAGLLAGNMRTYVLQRDHFELINANTAIAHEDLQNAVKNLFVQINRANRGVRVLATSYIQFSLELIRVRGEREELDDAEYPTRKSTYERPFPRRGEWDGPRAPWRAALIGLFDAEYYNDWLWDDDGENINFNHNTEVRLKLTVLTPPNGRGKNVYRGNTSELLINFLKRKKSVLVMSNTDNLCMPRAVFTLLCRSMNDLTYKGSQYERPQMKVSISDATLAWVRSHLDPAIKDSPKLTQSSSSVCYDQAKRGHRTQGVGAKLLLELCNIADHGDAMGIEEISVIEKTIGMRITIHNADTSNKCTYRGLKDLPEAPSLNLLNHNNHFHALTTITGYLGKSYYCAGCDISYSNLNGHVKCDQVCKHCQQGGCDAHLARAHGKPFPEAAAIRCKDCNLRFFSRKCYAGHKRKRNNSKSKDKRPRCDILHVCTKPNCKPFNPNMYSEVGEDEHQCGDKRCRNCQELLHVNEQSTHRCYMQTVKLKKPSTKIAFFDFECEQSTSLHNVTHVVAQYYGKSESHVWQPKEDGDFSTVLSDFLRWVFEGNGHNRYTFIAHNGQGYDFQFILAWALNNKMTVSSIQRAGTKLKHMEIEHVRFIDSYSFLTVPLSAFPKTFGLSELSKGYFPHLFNRPENQNYSGAFPTPDTYIPDSMSPSNYDKFKVWYSNESHGTFNFREEILKYCKSDVDILRRGCEVFRETFLDEVKLDPFMHITIASACMSLYRSTFMPVDTLGILTPDESKFIRRGFYGGRTNVMKAHDNTKDAVGSEIRYADVKSLYPYVNYTCNYPKGIPTFKSLNLNRKDSEELIRSNPIGFFEVSYKAPKNLRHPVLPSRRDGRLVFSLQPQDDCVHSGVELVIALDKGYKITVTAALTWSEHTTDIFKDYVSHFLKAKEEASGWKDKLVDGKQVVTVEEKHQWIEEFKQRQGVTLEYDNVMKNPGRRAIAKLCLNSLWGKLGQSTNPVKTEYHKIPADVFKLLEEKEVKEIIDITNEIVEVNFKEKGGAEQESFTTCLSIAALTTAHARTVLYKGLDTVGDNALYCDTDSIIYKWLPGGSEIPIGDLLGDWTNELDEDNEHIVEFVGCGPKLYAYRTNKGTIAVKAKGFRVTESAKHVLSFKNFRNALKVVKRKLPQSSDECIYETDVHGSQIVCSRYTRSLKTQPQKKRFKPTCDGKGVVDAATMDIYPYAYVKNS